MSEPEPVTCKGCGRTMAWGITAEGKRIPLDPLAPIYQLGELGTQGVMVERIQGHGFMVSHFATCREANRFSAGAKRK